MGHLAYSYSPQVTGKIIWALLIKKEWSITPMLDTRFWGLLIRTGMPMSGIGERRRIGRHRHRCSQIARLQRAANDHRQPCLEIKASGRRPNVSRGVELEARPITSLNHQETTRTSVVFWVQIEWNTILTPPSVAGQDCGRNKKKVSMRHHTIRRCIISSVTLNFITAFPKRC